jgi:hypothetical protein
VPLPVTPAGGHGQAARAGRGDQAQVVPRPARDRARRAPRRAMVARGEDERPASPGTRKAQDGKEPAGCGGQPGGVVLCLPSAAARVGQALPGMPAVGGAEDHRVRGARTPGDVAVDRDVDDRRALPDHLGSNAAVAAGHGNMQQGVPAVRTGGAVQKRPPSRVAATRGHSPLAQGASARAHPRWSLTQVRPIRNEPASADPAGGPGRLVMAGAAGRAGLLAAEWDGDGDRWTSRSGAGPRKCPAQPATLVTMLATATSSHLRLTHRRRPNIFSGCKCGQRRERSACHHVGHHQRRWRRSGWLCPAGHAEDRFRFSRLLALGRPLRVAEPGTGPGICQRTEIITGRRVNPVRTAHGRVAYNSGRGGRVNGANRG